MASSKVLKNDDVPYEETPHEANLQEMIAKDERSPYGAVSKSKQRSRKSSTWKDSKVKIIAAVAVTLCIGVFIGVYVGFKKTNENDNDEEVVVQDAKDYKQDVIMETVAEQAHDDFDYYEEVVEQKAPQLRSSVENKYPKKRNSMGYVSIYVRKNSQGRRPRYTKTNFPAAQLPRQNNPLQGPFFNFLPQVPIFTDRLTKQTLIFSQLGGVYIMPPLVNSLGHIFSVAELIASGYASLVSTGSLPVGPINMLPFFHSVPLVGPNVPTFRRTRGGFTRGFRTNFGDFPVPDKFRHPSEDYVVYSLDEYDDSDEYTNSNDLHGEDYSKNNRRRPGRIATADMYLDSTDTLMGTITLEEIPGTTFVRVTGSLPGFGPSMAHGFHAHRDPLVDGERNCSFAGPHYNPFNTLHGPRLADIKQRHVGDFGNVTSDETNMINIFFTDHIIKLDESPRSVVGRTLIIHANRDCGGRGGFPDSTTTGNAGARLSCGVVRLKETSKPAKKYD